MTLSARTIVRSTRYYSLCFGVSLRRFKETKHYICYIAYLLFLQYPNHCTLREIDNFSPFWLTNAACLPEVIYPNLQGV